MKLSVIGTGYVGLVTGTVFAHKGHEVLCVDKDPRKIDSLRRGEMPIYEPGLAELVTEGTAAGRLRFGTKTEEAVDHGTCIFVCVDTPPRPDGTADLSSIEAVSRAIAENLSNYRVVVEKSTVPVLTGERVQQTIAKYGPDGVPFDVVSNPEFLREGSAVEDSLHPDRIVVGVTSRKAEGVMRELYEGFDAPLIVTDIKSAEMIKHASNSFLAMKISFINLVANVCEAAGADVAEVARGMGLDARIGERFLRPGIGYGGSCFPKDVAAFAKIAEQLGVPARLLEEIQKINRLQRERFLRKIEEELWVVKGKRVAILGLAFKPETDDIRESPAIEIAAKLSDHGAQVAAYDPQAMERARAVLPDVEFCDDPYAAIQGADCMVLCTEWPAFADLDLAKVRSLMKHPTVIDGRNLYDPGRMRELGFTYRSVGRPAPAPGAAAGRGA